MIEFEDCKREDPFKSAREFYQNISKFFEEKANEFVLHFTLAIPYNTLKNQLYVWNDTKTKPAIRIEFHVDVTDTWKDCIIYSMKEQKDGSFQYIVERTQKEEKFKFKTEEQALNCVTEMWNRIFNE